MSVTGLVVRFSLAGLVVMVLLGTVLAVLARQAGTAQAVDSARQVAWVTGRGIAEPRLGDALLAGDPQALAAFDADMHRYVLQGSLVRVKLWDPDGRVLYSDEARLVGQTFGLGEDEREALEDGSTDSEISDLSAPENVYERPFGKLLEVYVGLTSADGRPLLFEAYFRYDAVVTAATAEWRKYAPPTLAGLLALQLVQIPFAWSLARRLQRQQRDRQRLLQRAVDASQVERRRIAADLHDGVVQDLTGLTYALDAARLGPDDPEGQRELVGRSAAQLRASVADLRTLLVEIYPPDLAEEGLPAALTDLAAGLERAGLSVEVDVDDAAGLPLDVSSVLFRSGQEVLRNVVAHSDARHVALRAAVRDGIASLVVDDDGRGFDAGDLDRRFEEGHIGLRSLGDLIDDSGGTLTVRSAPGQGTRVEILVPVG
ncbi:Histidine kinase-, DNA gyrase B-, and HSP90-like ATPase [Microlunatus flavus]|uniref:histidine kinase n=1 Tax=Microlunatus flavus TaxID=1036181 RepID=A0A1H9C209_9ACTN|nr:Histidine kinase-, DNA gyrase B-, and HSP90-like ATPase [Microlunatus flavus]